MPRNDRLRLALAVAEASLFGPLAGAAIFCALTFLKQTWAGDWRTGVAGVRDAWPVGLQVLPLLPFIMLGITLLSLVAHRMLYGMHYRRGLPYAAVGVALAVIVGWPVLSEIAVGTVGDFLGDARAEAILVTGFAAGVFFWRRRRPDRDPP